jgi:hypothetical protein
MSSTEEGFLELLEGEVSVDMDKLRDVGMHGIPDNVRGEVWKYLLGVCKPEHPEGQERSLQQDYLAVDKNNVETLRQIRKDVKRYRTNTEFFKHPKVRTQMENVLVSFINHNSSDYNINLIHLLGPFICCLKSESDMFHCYKAWMAQIEEHLNLPVQLSKFMMLFRSVQPELFTYFEEEEISPNDWATSWLSTMLARELPLDCVLRLWDTYFCLRDPFDLHIYVCLAILMENYEELLELEHTEELRGFLQHLPPMDMDLIITQAYTLKEEIKIKALI